MNRVKLSKIFAVIVLFFLIAPGAFAQNKNPKTVEVTTVTEDELTPSVLKNLPDWERVKNSAVYIRGGAELKNVFSQKPILDAVDFTGGTDAATASYNEGRLLIIEYATPQAAADGDAYFQQRLAENPPTDGTFYRRTGNYSVFVFDAPDEVAANNLLDQVKYSKTVQWLGTNPNILRRAEAAFAKTASQIFLSTFKAIGLGIGSTILLGLLAGALVFYSRKRQRRAISSFTDAGGMIRLNLDELTDMPTVGLLKK